MLTYGDVCKVADFAYPRMGQDVAMKLRKAIQDEQGRGQGRQEGGWKPDESWVTSAVVYMSPEILTCGESSCASDVYAFGMLTYEVLAKNDPYSKQECSLVEILKEIVKVLRVCVCVCVRAFVRACVCTGQAGCSSAVG